jgi:cell division protein FtsI (penicillin-binding protein 3)
MTQIPPNKRKIKQFFILFFLIILAFFIFLIVMIGNIISNKNIPNLYIEKETRAIRGSIITADGFHVAKSEKLYKAVINKRYLDNDKKDLFVSLFSIYSNIPKEKILKKLNTKRSIVVLSYNIPQKEAKYLKQLSYELRRYKVFKSLKNPKTGIYTIQGLSILESGESRIYPYKDTLTPVIGYTHKIEDNGYTLVKGVKGIEKRWEEELKARANGKISGQRDVNGYILLNKESFVQEPLNGYDIKLTINLSLQIRIEKALDNLKKKMDAYEVYAVIIDSKSGKILSLASSNRFLPKAIRRKDYKSLNISATEFVFEPGSVIKPITFSILLKHNLVNPFELVNGHNGKYKIKRKVITDEHRFKWLSAEDVIVHSSNVGIAQLAQRLNGIDFYNGFLDFQLTKNSTDDLIYERKGKIPSAKRLNNEIYKATSSYGYGLEANLLQLVRAYSVFNNDGKMFKPYLVDSLIDENEIIPIEREEAISVLKPATALRMKKILIKTVMKGTGKKAITPGLVIGGKTGTAHIVEKGKYVHKYNTSFIGFANDKTHKYTIGVVVRQPKTNHFASQTAVPVFKKIVDIMINEGYLTP